MINENEIVERSAIKLGKCAGELMRQFQEEGFDCTPIEGESFLGTLLRLIEEKERIT